jgi:hypothetical protein
VIVPWLVSPRAHLRSDKPFSQSKATLGPAERSNTYLLWAPELEEHGGHQLGPRLREVFLPAGLWLVGLGNLGQAYLWSLTLLPYAHPDEVFFSCRMTSTSERRTGVLQFLFGEGATAP